jgi:hypothetical protein
VMAFSGRLGANRVLTMPGLGAFAMMTNVRSPFVERMTVWLEDSMVE